MGDSDKSADMQGPVSQYANGLQIGHNAFEFVLAFVQQYGATTAPTHTRIVTSPAYAKSFLHALMSSIAQYEAEFGIITAADADIERDGWAERGPRQRGDQ